MFTRLTIGIGSSIAWIVIALMSVLTRLLAGTRFGLLLQTVGLSRVRRQPLQTSAAAFGIALGVAVLVAVTIVNHSIMAGVGATAEELAGKADLQIAGGSSGFAESILSAVRELPEVASATPVTEQIASAFGPNGKRERVMVMGLDLVGSEDANFRSYRSSELDALRRDQLGFLNATNNIIIGRGLAQRLGLKLHDKLRIGVGTGVQEFDIWGLVEIEGGGRAFGGSVVLMYYPAMQAAFARADNIDRIDIAVAPGTTLEQATASVQRRLGDGLSVQPPGQRVDRLKKMLLAVRAGLITASICALLAGAYLVFNTSAINVVQRRRELGIMRAIGATRRQLVRLLTLEAVLVGTVGSALGVLIGIFLSGLMLNRVSAMVSEMYVQQGVTEVHIDPPMLLISFVLGVVTTATAARLASQRASEVPPVEALSFAREQRFGVPKRGFSKLEFLGLGLLLAIWPLLRLPPYERVPLGPMVALVVSILSVQTFVPRLLTLTRRLWDRPARGAWGASAALAVDSVFRDVGRSAAMAAGVTAGVALVVSLSTFVDSFLNGLNDWVERSLAGDLLVTSGNSVSAMSTRNTPLDPGVGGELLSIPNVRQVRPIRIVDHEFHGHVVKVLSTDMAMYARSAQIDLLEGDAATLVERLEHGAIAVSENFSRKFDVHRGDKLLLGTHAGATSFDVAAVMVDYTSDLGVLILDRSTYIASWADSRVDTYELFLTAGANPETVRSQIDQRLGERFDLFVLTNRDFREEIVRSAGQAVKLMRVLVLLTMVLAALGLMTTVLASVMHRIRELGVFRAIGMLRSQVAKMVTIEAVLIAYIGAGFGVLLGCFAGYIILEHIMVVELGWHFAFRLPALVLGQTLLLLPLLAAIAGYLPARKAARLQLRDALGYE